MALPQSGKKYIIMNVGTSTVVDLDKGNSNNETKIQGFELLVKDYSDTQPHQIWRADFAARANDYDWFTFTNVGSNTRIDNMGGADGDANRITGYVIHPDDPNQQWAPVRVNRGSIPCYVLYNRTPVKRNNTWCCMDLNGGSKANGTNISLFKGNVSGDNRNQVWMFIEVQ